MTPNLHRAALLLQQSRFDLAEPELRGVLAESPHDPHAHALLALCLTRLDKLDEAQAEAEQAIVLAPDWAFSHYCRAAVMEQRRRYKEAEAAAREAVRLEPSDADYHAQLASTLFAQQKWQPTLDAAMEGLAHNAEHQGCTHLRTMALTKLNRNAEAIAAVDESLARQPESGMAHCNKGWALLHQGQPREALVHFRESLRLEPTLDYARMGMIEAIKARNPIYRAMLAYFLWMGRLSNRARWIVILGGWFGAKLLDGIAIQVPALAPWITPILIAYAIFVVLTWFAAPLSNLVLRLHPMGCHALSRDQRSAANWFGVCLLVFVIGMAMYFTADSEMPLIVAVISLGMALPLTMLYACDPGWPRQAMMLYSAAMAAVGALAIVGAALNQEWGFQLFMGFLFGAIGAPWIVNILAGVTPTR